MPNPMQHDMQNHKNRKRRNLLPWAMLWIALLVFIACGQKGDDASNSTDLAVDSAHAESDDNTVAASSETTLSQTSEVQPSETSEAPQSDSAEVPPADVSEVPPAESSESQTTEDPLASYVPLKFPVVTGVKGAAENESILADVENYLNVTGPLQLHVHKYSDVENGAFRESFPNTRMHYELQFAIDKAGNAIKKGHMVNLSKSVQADIPDDVFEFGDETYFMKNETGQFQSYAYDSRSKNWVSTGLPAVDNILKQEVPMEYTYMAPYLQTTEAFVLPGETRPVVALVGNVPASEFKAHDEAPLFTGMLSEEDSDTFDYSDFGIGVAIVVDQETHAPVRIEIDSTKVQKAHLDIAMQQELGIEDSSLLEQMADMKLNLYLMVIDEIDNQDIPAIALPTGVSYEVPYTEILPTEPPVESPESVDH